jgi:acetyl esterase/lipase
VTVTGCDIFRDEGIAYALTLRNAGVDTQLEIVPGITHGIDFCVKSHAVQQFLRNQVRVLNCALYTDF